MSFFLPTPLPFLAATRYRYKAMLTRRVPRAISLSASVIRYAPWRDVVQPYAYARLRRGFHFAAAASTRSAECRQSDTVTLRCAEARAAQIKRRAGRVRRLMFFRAPMFCHRCR